MSSYSYIVPGGLYGCKSAVCISVLSVAMVTFDKYTEHSTNGNLAFLGLCSDWTVQILFFFFLDL